MQHHKEQIFTFIFTLQPSLPHHHLIQLAEPGRIIALELVAKLAEGLMLDKLYRRKHLQYSNSQRKMQSQGARPANRASKYSEFVSEASMPTKTKVPHFTRIDKDGNKYNPSLAQFLTEKIRGWKARKEDVKIQKLMEKILQRQRSENAEIWEDALEHFEGVV